MRAWVVIVALLGVLGGGQASAAGRESTWILWIQAVGPVPNWEVFNAYDTSELCRASLARRAKTLARTDYKLDLVANHNRATITDRTGDTTLYTLLCLPDSVDPRAPNR
jgi:hypothetical protein